MGNGFGKFTSCLCGSAGLHLPRRRSSHHHDIAMVMSEPYDEGLGHSFCYVRPEPSRLSSSKVHHSSEETTTTFRSISGASISANTSTALSTSLVFDPYSYASGGLLAPDRSAAAAAAFDCSTSFTSVPLQPVPRLLLNSGPLSGPMDRGFMSGPIERGFMSGPLDRAIFSGPLDKSSSAAADQQIQRSFSHGDYAFRPRVRRASLIRGLRRAIARTIARGQNSTVAPIKGAAVVSSAKESDAAESGFASSGTTLSSEQSLEDSGDDAFHNPNLQWAQGKAGEDRVHVVISEEHGWVFVGIYDGFNGPDAPDYLLSNLYSAVHEELKGLLWEDNYGNMPNSAPPPSPSPPPQESDDPQTVSINLRTMLVADDCCKAKGSKKKFRGAAKKWEESQRRWKWEWDRERIELDRKLKEQLAQSNTNTGTAVNHSEVLKALSTALHKTEEAYLDIADNMVSENPELALMGSCVLAMLMKGEDVYLLNVGDSRAVLAQKAEPDLWGSVGKARQDLERIKEETLYDLEGAYDGDQMDGSPNLAALQLTLDHSTCVEEEVRRIKKEHPNDPSAVVNDRVKGSLKVTRAFGAGFLKQPKWNEALLEMFRIDYIGNSPYISCNPSLYHHRLCPKDRFLILSSDGLYQYFTNEEVVAQVELFISSFPEGDPAQHLVEEVLFRAAKKAGMDFHELLEIPQGDRRRYHDDMSIIVISLEGRIWRYCV